MSSFKSTGMVSTQGPPLVVKDMLGSDSSNVSSVKRHFHTQEGTDLLHVFLLADSPTEAKSENYREAHDNSRSTVKLPGNKFHYYCYSNYDPNMSLQIKQCP